MTKVDSRTHGQAAWKAVEKRELTLGWANPWRRYAASCFVFTIAAGTVATIGGSGGLPSILVLGAMAASVLLMAVWFGRSEHRHGRVVCKVSSEAVTLIGGSAELTIPWIAIDEARPPRVGREQFLRIPIKGLENVQRSASGRTAVWDGVAGLHPLLQIGHDEQQSWIEVRSKPPEFARQLSLLLLPMMHALGDRRTKLQQVKESTAEQEFAEAIF